MPLLSASGTRAAASRVISFGTLLLALLLVAAVGLNLANVLSRYLFSQAIVGAEEIQVFIMIWIAFIGAGVVAWRGEHLRMDVIAVRLPPRLRTLLAGAEAALVVLLALFMLYQSVTYTVQMVQLDRNSDALGVPMAIPHTGLILGFGLLAAVAVLRLFGIRAPVPAAAVEAEL